MYSVSEAYLKAINADTRDMPYQVKIDGDEFDQSRVTKMTLTESASGNNGVSIGTANSASLTLSLKKAPSKDYKEVVIEPESGIVLPNGETEWVPLGKFWVTDFKTSNDFEDLSLTCADGMYLLRNEYESKLAYPTTLEDFVREICDDTVVEFEDFDSIPNISLRLKPDKMTYRNAIGYAAGCCGKNARFNRSGKLEFFWYEDTGVTIGRKTQYMNGMTKLSQDAIEVGIEVEGREELYSVEVISGGGGGATATPGEKVKEGEPVSVSISPSFGYELYSLSVRDKNGEITTYRNSSNNYEFTQRDGNSMVTVAFKDIESVNQKVNFYAYDGGVITTSNVSGRYEEGATVRFFVALEEGYNVDRIVAAPADLVITPKGITENLSLVYDFTMPPCEVTVSVYFKQDAVAQQRYTMSRSSTSNKKITLTYENPLISEKVQADVQSHVQGISYTPAKVKHRGNPALQAGDVVFVTDKDGIDHKIPILQQTFNFGGGMNSEISAPGETENKQTFSSNGPFSTQIKKEVQKSVEEVERRLSSSNSLAFSSLSKVIGESEAYIDAVVELKGDNVNAIAETIQYVDSKKSQIDSIASFNETVAAIQQEVNAQKGQITIAVGRADEAAAKAEDVERYLESIRHEIGYINEDISEISVKVEDNISQIGMIVKNGSVDASVIISAINCGESKIAITGNRFTVESDNLTITDDGTIYSYSGFIGGWSIGTDKLFSVNNSAGTAVYISPSSLKASKGSSEYDISWYDLAVNSDSYKSQEEKIRTLNSGYTGSLIVMCPTAYTNQYTKKTLTFEYGILTSIS